MKIMRRLWKPALILAVLIVSLGGAATAAAQAPASVAMDTPAQQTVHVVKSGETLFSISQQYGVSIAAIQAANGLTSTLIYVGQRLVIPTGTSGGNISVYVVQPGDTLYSLAQSFRVPLASIRAVNGWGPDYSFIFVGQRIFIPTGTSSGGTTAYTVRSGDTLYSIARRYNTTVAAIQTANSLSGTRIYTGQLLNIPTSGSPQPRTYVVKAGDYLSAIAARYGVTTAALATANGITNPSLIYPGQVLVIP